LFTHQQKRDFSEFPRQDTGALNGIAKKPVARAVSGNVLAKPAPLIFQRHMPCSVSAASCRKLGK
jgi:hypothetical protein